MFHMQIAFIGHTLFLLRKLKNRLQGYGYFFSRMSTVSIGSGDAERAPEASR
jgi:hypothetical protein